MSDQDTPVLVAWPIASPLAMFLQGDTPVPRGGPVGDQTTAPVSMVPLPTYEATSGPVFPTTGAGK